MTQASFAARITRQPRILNADAAQEAAALVSQVPPEVRGLASAAASCAPYLMALLKKEHAWFEAGRRAAARRIRSARRCGRASGAWRC